MTQHVINATYLAAREAGGKIKQTEHHLTSGKDGGDLTADKARKAIQRDFTKARKIAANVGRGEFPGKYRGAI